MPRCEAVTRIGSGAPETASDSAATTPSPRIGVDSSNTPPMIPIGTVTGQGRAFSCSRNALPGTRSILAAPVPSRSPPSGEKPDCRPAAHWSRSSSHTRSRAQSEPWLGVPARMTPCTEAPATRGGTATGCRHRDTKSRMTSPPMLWPTSTRRWSAGRSDQEAASRSALMSTPLIVRVEKLQVSKPAAPSAGTRSAQIPPGSSSPCTSRTPGRRPRSTPVWRRKIPYPFPGGCIARGSRVCSCSCTWPRNCRSCCGWRSAHPLQSPMATAKKPSATAPSSPRRRVRSIIQHRRLRQPPRTG